MEHLERAPVADQPAEPVRLGVVETTRQRHQGVCAMNDMHIGQVDVCVVVDRSREDRHPLEERTAVVGPGREGLDEAADHAHLGRYRPQHLVERAAPWPPELVGVALGITQSAPYSVAATRDMRVIQSAW